jgi:glycosyltransferase involved in cell wall biosynthesis
VRVIPNCLDFDVFRPRDKPTIREILGLPSDKRLLLMGAATLGDSRKGMDLAVAALEQLPVGTRSRIELVIYGKRGEHDLAGIKTNWMGFLRDELSLALLYNACDVFIAPSRMDNLPNTCVEAAASGVPIVAFDIGGMSDIVLHKESGYLAQPFDALDFLYGIQWVLNSMHEKCYNLGEIARSHAENRFSPHIVCKQYIDAYRNIQS